MPWYDGGMHVLLSGIVGSTAYGLNTPESDVDLLGIFAAPTTEFHGLTQPAESHVTTHPDSTYHEARKAMRLMLSCNPTVTEILWLPNDLYETRTYFGDELVRFRIELLAYHRVRNAYLGYATQQFKKLEARGDGSFSADTRKRIAKHARHLYRLCHQGYTLHATGTLSVRLDDPQKFLDFGEHVADGNIEAARDMLAHYEGLFNWTPTVLPDEPNTAAAESWLQRVRKEYL